MCVQSRSMPKSDTTAAQSLMGAQPRSLSTSDTIVHHFFVSTESCARYKCSMMQQQMMVKASQDSNSLGHLDIDELREFASCSG